MSGFDDDEEEYQGTVTVSRPKAQPATAASGPIAQLAELHSGAFFGEIALFEGVARSATALAHTRVRLIRLDRADLLRLMEDMPGIAVTLLQALSRRVRELTDRLLV